MKNETKAGNWFGRAWRAVKVVAVAVAVGIVTLCATPAMAATDITGVVSDVSGYQAAAAVVGIAVLLFVLGRKVIRRLIVALMFGSLLVQSSMAATDITGVVSDVSGYQAAAAVVGIAVLLFVLGRKVIRRLI